MILIEENILVKLKKKKKIKGSRYKIQNKGKKKKNIIRAK